MKPVLVIGLGNPLMGDDAIGWHVVECLQADLRLPGGIEVVHGGTDLLRFSDRMQYRSRVVVIDAAIDGRHPGAVTVYTGSLEELDHAQTHSHHLSPALAIRLLQMTIRADFTLLTISIAGAARAGRLSEEIEQSVPEILDRVVEVLAAA